DLAILIPVVGLLLLSVSGVGATENPPSFAEAFRVELVSDSFWGQCTMLIDATRAATAMAQTSCSGPAGRRDAVRTGKLALDANDLAALRSQLKAARLFEGQFWGHDNRGIDMELVTLRVETSRRVAILVVNESFTTGPRRTLVDTLRQHLASSMATAGK